MVKSKAIYNTSVSALLTAILFGQFGQLQPAHAQNLTNIKKQSTTAAAGGASSTKASGRPATKSNAQVALTPDEATNIRVYKSCNQAVVNLSPIATAEDLYFNIMPKEGCGSGSVISQDGYILTNFHVIKGATGVRCTFADGTSLVAKVIGGDPANDLAVLKVAPPAGKKLTTISLGDSNRLEVGRRVFAIGNPFGLDRTLTQGIVSSLGRTLKAEDINGNSRLIKGIIQTDAAINPGNSGGPLLDTAGNMVGINTAIFSLSGQSAGIGFAIPVNIAKRIVPELIAHHGVTRTDLGIHTVPVHGGLRILGVERNGPAHQAGLSGPKRVLYRDGPFVYEYNDPSMADTIIAIDNRPVTTPDDLLSYIEEKKPNQVVTLTVVRSGRVVKIPVKLAAMSFE